jgi:dCTP deaminase
MILSRPDLILAVQNRQIVFDPPLEDRQYGEASVDLRLGHSFTIFKPGFEGLSVSVAKGLQTLGRLQVWATKELRNEDELGQREVFKLDPGKFVLALTHESVTVPKNMIALIEGRSTYARVGLSMHQTAPWIQPGWSGRIVLEIMNHGPLTIELTPEIDKPCQLTFFHLTSEVPSEYVYGTRESDRYKDQQHPLVHGR